MSDSTLSYMACYLVGMCTMDVCAWSFQQYMMQTVTALYLKRGPDRLGVGAGFIFMHGYVPAWARLEQIRGIRWPVLRQQELGKSWDDQERQADLGAYTKHTRLGMLHELHTQCKAHPV